MKVGDLVKFKGASEGHASWIRKCWEKSIPMILVDVNRERWRASVVCENKIRYDHLEILEDFS